MNRKDKIEALKRQLILHPSYLNIIEEIEKDLELLEQLEILKKYYPPFKEFLEEMFEKGYNEDLTKIKEWLEND